MATERTTTLHGDLAVITGAGDGIGKAIAIKLATKGCSIALIDINEPKVNEVAKSLQSLFPSQQFHSFVCDASDQSQVNELPQRIQSAFNTSNIQLLFNNVGVAELMHTVLAGDMTRLRRVMDINVWSMIYSTRAFLPLLLNNPASKQCYIMNTGSIASIETGFSMYSITKHAVIALSETMREELKRYHGGKGKRISVSTLVPGFVDTNIRNMSSEVLGIEKEWKQVKQSEMYKNREGKMIKLTQIDVNVVADLVFELGIQQKKSVIPTHFEWHEAAIKDRMHALLNCEPDKKVNMKKAIKKSMAARSASTQKSKL